MQVIEAQRVWSWRLTITSISSMTGYELGVVKLEPDAAAGSFAPGRRGGLAARQRRLPARDWCGWPG
jgi:hypothetical protein